MSFILKSYIWFLPLQNMPLPYLYTPAYVPSIIQRKFFFILNTFFPANSRRMKSVVSAANCAHKLQLQHHRWTFSSQSFFDRIRDKSRRVIGPDYGKIS